MANRGGFSWRRLIGISALKSKIARKTGIPTSKSGRQQKIGRIVTGSIGTFALIVCGLSAILGGCSKSEDFLPAASATPTIQVSQSPAPTPSATPSPSPTATPKQAATPDPTSSIQPTKAPSATSTKAPAKSTGGGKTGTQSSGSGATTSDTVYIGQTGNKYHRSTCATLKGKGSAISRQAAISNGRAACKVCKP